MSGRDREAILNQLGATLSLDGTEVQGHSSHTILSALLLESSALSAISASYIDFAFFAHESALTGTSFSCLSTLSCSTQNQTTRFGLRWRASMIRVSF